MKTLICTLVVLVATVYAQYLAETLVKRAEEILHRARSDVHKLQSEGKGHLVAELERTIRSVEHLERELKAFPEGHLLEQHQVHLIEEQLLHQENRLVEELSRIESHDDNAPRERHHLLERAERLISEAKAELEKHRGHGHELLEIEHEIHRIEELVHELRVHPSNHVEAHHATIIEQRLVEHERRLAEELRKHEQHSV